MPGKSKGKKSADAKRAKTVQIPKAKKPPKTDDGGKARLVSSEVVFEGRLFNVVHDRVIEPGGHQNERDIVCHNGSAVILAVDNEKKNRKNPWVVMERQYRHAAGRYLWELPAGKIEPGEDSLVGAQRELAEETGYRAKNWSELVQFWPSPGFVGEWMKLFLAEGLIPGDALPEEDERIELRLVRLNEVLKMIGKGAIQDGKTLTGILLFARLKLKGRKK